MCAMQVVSVLHFVAKHVYITLTREGECSMFDENTLALVHKLRLIAPGLKAPRVRVTLEVMIRQGWCLGQSWGGDYSPILYPI